MSWSLIFISVKVVKLPYSTWFSTNDCKEKDPLAFLIHKRKVKLLGS